MGKIFILSLMLLSASIFNLLPVLGQREFSESPKAPDQGTTTSSGTRGCQQRLPKITLKNAPLYQKNPQIEVMASQKGYRIIVVMYPIGFGQMEQWTTEIVSDTDWLTLSPSIEIKPYQKYAVNLAIFCDGQIEGERISKVVEVNENYQPYQP